MSAKIPLRGCEPLGFRRWVANFKDCASKAKLNGLLQSRAVPTREAVVLSFPDQSEEQQQALYEDALRVYQIENTALFYMIAPSVDLRGGSRVPAAVWGDSIAPRCGPVVQL